MKFKILVWIMLLFGMVSLVNADIYDFLYAYYPLDNSEANISDKSFYNIDGVLVGNVSGNTECLVGNNECSLFFNGSLDSLDYINLSAGFWSGLGSSNYTKSFWINIKDTPKFEIGKEMGIYGLHRDSSDLLMFIEKTPSRNSLRINQITSGGYNILFNPLINFSYDKWYHIVLVANGSYAYVYVNNESYDEGDWFSLDFMYDRDNVLGVSDTFDEPHKMSFFGLIDEVSFWTTNFNKSMVEKLYVCGLNDINVEDCFDDTLPPPPPPPTNYTYLNDTGVLSIGDCPFNQDGSGLYVSIILLIGFLGIMVGLVTSITFLIMMGSLFFIFSYLFLSSCSNIIALLFLGIGLCCLIYTIFKGLD